LNFDIFLAISGLKILLSGLLSEKKMAFHRIFLPEMVADSSFFFQCTLSFVILLFDEFIFLLHKN